MDEWSSHDCHSNGAAQAIIPVLSVPAATLRELFTELPEVAGMADAPTICPTLLYADARAAIAQLTEAFGFTESALYASEDDGTVLHAELSYKGGVVMLGTKGREGVFAEAMAQAGPTGVYVAVADVDAHYARARAAGVEILVEPTDQDYGARDYLARDQEGNIWSFGSYAPAPEA